MKSPIRVAVADDSDTMRRVLLELVDRAPDLEAVGAARDGEEAVALAKSVKPTILTMDVLMPRLDGVEAIGRIMAAAPCRILVISSTADDKQVDSAFRAVRAGALEVLPKPRSETGEDLARWGERVVEAIRLMSEVPVVTRRRPVAPTPVPRAGTRIDAFALVASTGGPPVLAQILSRLPADLPIPLFAVQHISRGFTPGLRRYLASETPLAVEIAAAGSVCRPGCVYLPPDGCHLELDPDGILRTPPFARDDGPSGDRLLRALATAYGPRLGAAVLTGMGEDGARGLAEVRDAGGLALAQDPATCVVPGMPNAALTAGAAGSSLTPDALAAAILAGSCLD